MSKVRNWKTASFQFLLQNTTRTNWLERTRINIISCFHNANRLISIILLLYLTIALYRYQA